MGRVEDRRLRELERRAERAVSQAAASLVPDEDLPVLTGYGERALAAEDDGAPLPRPTPREREVLERYAALRERCRLEGWGRSEAP